MTLGMNCCKRFRNWRRRCRNLREDCRSSRYVRLGRLGSASQPSQDFSYFYLFTRHSSCSLRLCRGTVMVSGAKFENNCPIAVVDNLFCTTAPLEAKPCPKPHTKYGSWIFSNFTLVCRGTFVDHHCYRKLNSRINLKF